MKTNPVVEEMPNKDNKRELDTSGVTRFEVIDHRKSVEEGGGRIVVEYGVKVEVSIQDGGKTMKVFLN